MNDKKNDYDIFGKAIPQLIHDIRNPLNIIMGFSSILQMEESTSVNDEIKNYLKKIYQAGAAIEQMLSNIDIYIMGIEELTKDYFDIFEEIESFIKSKEDIIAEKSIYFHINNNHYKNIKINFSSDLFRRILENIFYFSLKGFRNSKIKEIFLAVEKENNSLKLIYGDSTDVIPINSPYFTIDEILNNKRGLGLIFLKKFIQYAKGDVRYLYSNEWSGIAKDFNIKTEHGFIITLPVEFIL